MIRETHTIIIFGKEYKVGDLLWIDFISMNYNPQKTWEKILGEFNDQMPELNSRQSQELWNFLIEPINSSDKKGKNENKEQKLQDQLIIIEGQLMKNLHQSLSEIRNRTLKYIMAIYNKLPEILGYAKEKNDKLDKKGLKRYLGEFYTQKK